MRILLTLITLIISTLSFSDWQEDSLKALQEGNYELRYKILREAAEYDDNAKFEYARELAIEDQHDEALNIYHELTEKGYSKPLLEIAMIYVYMKEGDEYTQKGFHLMHLAAQHSVEAQAELGVLYQEGIGTEINFKVACAWFRTAQENGVRGRGVQEKINKSCN